MNFCWFWSWVLTKMSILRIIDLGNFLCKVAQLMPMGQYWHLPHSKSRILAPWKEGAQCLLALHDGLCQNETILSFFRQPFNKCLQVFPSCVQATDPLFTTEKGEKQSQCADTIPIAAGILPQGRLVVELAMLLLSHPFLEHLIQHCVQDLKMGSQMFILTQKILIRSHARRRTLHWLWHYGRE